MVLFEPIVGFVLCAFAILGLLISLLFRFVDVGKHFPFFLDDALPVNFIRSGALGISPGHSGNCRLKVTSRNN
jgi:hypothetical protein